MPEINHLGTRQEKARKNQNIPKASQPLESAQFMRQKKIKSAADKLSENRPKH